MADLLVVASKVKNVVKTIAQMNTSASFLDALSAKVMELCRISVENARRDGRKTVKDRDLPTGTPTQD